MILIVWCGRAIERTRSLLEVEASGEGTCVEAFRIFGAGKPHCG